MCVVDRGCPTRLAARALLATVFIAVFLSSAHARSSYLVVEANNGQTLYEAEANEPRYPASLTKMMTLYLVFEALDKGALRLGEYMTASERAAAQPPTRIGLDPGDRISVEQAILALVTKSANDAATVVAERLGGTEGRFAEMMTTRAHRLGMSRTTFQNASGLPNFAQTTTARDMATLARALLRDFPDYYHYFSAPAFSFGGIQHANHNGMLAWYPGLDGIKTGYTQASGFNLVASAKRGGTRLIGVVLGARSPAERQRVMADLLDDGFRSTGAILVAQNGNAPVALPSVAARKFTPPPSDDGSWAIQLAAYSRQGPALNAARAAARAAPTLLAGHAIKVVQTREGRNRRGYAARIIDLDRDEANRACRILKGKKQSCAEVSVRRGSAMRLTSGTEIGKTAPTKPFRLATAGPVGDRPWAVQVGAFPVYRDAHAVARRAVKTLPGVLEDGRIQIETLSAKGKGKSKPLYRARILGIDKEQAALACKRLEARDMACTAMPM